jgi:hypothetical protein
VADAAKDLKSIDPQKRQKAAKKLGEIAQTAKDEQARKDAKDALKDADVKPDDVKKPKEGPSGSDGQPMEPKEKPADDKSPPNNPKGGTDKGDGQPQDKKNPTDKKGPGQSGPGNHTNSHPDEKVADDTLSKPPTPEKPVEQKASVLQLRKFLEAVDPKVLDDAKADPAKWKQLEDQARKYLKDHPPADAKETLAGSRQGPLNSTAGRVSNSAGQTATDDPDNGGRALPPPGYRDPYKEFTKQLLRPDGK